MNLDDYFDFLSPDDIRIKGTRVGIETVLSAHLHRRWSPHRIAREYPSVGLEAVYATILYYLHNREAIERYVAGWLEYSSRAQEEHDKNPLPVVQRLRELKAERDATEARAG